jgi:hypothetical protein
MSYVPEATRLTTLPDRDVELLGLVVALLLAQQEQRRRPFEAPVELEADLGWCSLRVGRAGELCRQHQAGADHHAELQQAAPCRDAGRARAGIVSVPGGSGTNTGGHWRSVEMRHGISPWIVISEGFVRKGRARF